MNTKARAIAAHLGTRLLGRWLAAAVLALGAALALLRPVAAQDALELASPEELYDVVGPIALYPDDLVAIVLPASTYPLQVVQAARFLEDRKRNSNLAPNDEWDDSIVALLNYPEVVELMNDDLDWTYDLGTAVLNQRADVLNAIQDFRDQAYAAGNLRSDERQTVARDDGAIAIRPADPEVIYVPYYEPERVVVYQPAPVYFYYPHRYPVYYYPYPAHYVFDTGFFWGVRSWFTIGWHTHHVHVYDWYYRSHPYFGWNYYDPFYVRNIYVNVNVNRSRDYIWEPRNRYGGRPVVRGYEGRVYTANRTPRTRDANTATSRTREGTVYRQGSTAARTVDQAARTSRQATNVETSRTAPTASYRARGAETNGRALSSGQSSRTTRTAPAERGTTSVPTRGGYRNGSAALERSGSPQPNREARTSGAPTRTAPSVSPRNVERSTGMPRESSRAGEVRNSTSVARAPTQGGGNVQRGSSDGQRGNAGGQRSSAGGSYRGNAGRERSAAR